MNIIDKTFMNEQEPKEEKKKSKFTLGMKLILLTIVILIFVVIGSFFAITYIEQTELNVYLDGVQNNKIKSLILQEDDKIYFSIKDIAVYLGYASYNGEYTDKSEDINKCYIQSEDEIVNFVLKSKEIYKLDPKDNSNYKNITIENEIKSIDGKLCIEANDMQKAFNVSYSYNGKNKMNIYTLNYLVEAYATKIASYGYVITNNSFFDKKSLLDGVLIVQKDEKYYGVIDLQGNIILEAKYDNIQYLSNTGDFLVKSNGKVGIISKNKETKVSILYTNLKLIDPQYDLYLAQKDNKYGIIDSNGNIKIYIEYDAIGIDASRFSQNEIKNKYILVDNIIPVRKDEKWALFDIKGKQLTEFVYDSFGYIATNNKDVLNLLVIPDYSAFVACKNEKYVLMDSTGTEKGFSTLDSIYMKISEGQKHYYMTYNNKTYNVEEYLDLLGVKKKI